MHSRQLLGSFKKVMREPVRYLEAEVDEEVLKH